MIFMILSPITISGIFWGGIPIYQPVYFVHLDSQHASRFSLEKPTEKKCRRNNHINNKSKQYFISCRLLSVENYKITRRWYWSYSHVVRGDDSSFEKRNKPPYIVIATTTTILLRIFSSVALVKSSLIAFALFWILLICRRRIVYLQNCMMQLIVGPMIRSITLTLFVFRNMCMRDGTIIGSSRKYDKTFLILSKILERKKKQGETGHASIGLGNSSTYLVT